LAEKEYFINQAKTKITI